ncbi:hypothetical protein, partial [Roseobacter cerasinus]|uniref:hypothetical protein n=1 Tax=Roseobacter cerasinus TaxID=2602289 RepID=UPI001EEC33ED
SLVLFQNANDLFFAETASLHRLSPQLENRLTKIRGHFRGAGQTESLQNWTFNRLSKRLMFPPRGRARI